MGGDPAEVMCLLFTVLFTMLFIADTNCHEAKKKTLAVQGFLVEVAGFEPAAFWSRTISKAA